MSDETRIAREQVDRLMEAVTMPPHAAYDAVVVRIMMILHELCSAVENIERWQSMLLELHKAQEPGPEGDYNTYPLQG